MADIKKKLIEQIDGLLRKGELPESEHRTLITKVELADPRFLEMAMAKFQGVRKSIAEEEEKVKKANGAAAAAAPTPAPTPAPASPAAAAKPAAPATGGGITGAARSAVGGSDIAGVGSGTKGAMPVTAGVGG